jgi:hypothetical protein
MRQREESPLEALQRGCRIRCQTAERNMARHGRRFLLLQLACLGSLLFWTQFRWPPDPWVGFALGTIFHASWFFSLHAAGYAAYVAVSNASVLETAWVLIGLAPWGLLLLQVTAFLVLII